MISFHGVRDFICFISCEKGPDEEETLVIARVSVEFLTVSSTRALCLSCLLLYFQNLAYIRYTIFVK